MTQPLPLSAQVVLITGASTGIGAALAKLLATKAPGIRLVLAARRLDRLQVVASFCEEAGAKTLIVPTDLSQVSQAEALVDAAFKAFGQVNVLVNNAGYGQMGPVELVSIPAVERQLQVNLVAPIALIQALIPSMRQQGSGRIINVSSIAGRLSFPFGGIYSASKFGLEALSDALRMELQPFNIDVSVIEPGPVKTEFFQVAQKMTSGSIEAPETTPYRACFEHMEGFEERMKGNTWSSERVAQVIYQAIAATKPRPRYIAATGGEILLFMMEKVLPTWMVDAFWQKLYGIDRISGN
ncbi:SDR family NAD(P)-dependent oxidoreductase [Merismopedia glauca]|uniref:Oxidoreductase n=1 Tax=Merismopedia glauca CCAP 1448/3 TaxID=1296344 RepID=A0A2T1C6U6_9CYAN|nr:SDR family oxidoreductase [Merismopedia glauca]PSB03964.1 oxidoreductase [Merismopedia glauca CCAP 1448/3]